MRQPTRSKLQHVPSELNSRQLECLHEYEMRSQTWNERYSQSKWEQVKTREKKLHKLSPTCEEKAGFAGRGPGAPKQGWPESQSFRENVRDEAAAIGQSSAQRGIRNGMTPPSFVPRDTRKWGSRVQDII